MVDAHDHEGNSDDSLESESPGILDWVSELTGDKPDISLREVAAADDSPAPLDSDEAAKAGKIMSRGTESVYSS